MRVSIIIPAYNEAQAIGLLVSDIRSRFPDFEVIVVDDGSTDQTASAAEKAGALVYSHPYNIGNGAAVKAGIRIASGDVLVFMDGDGQHDPEDIAEMLRFFPQFDMVVGWRKKGGQSSTWRSFGNRVYNLLASYAANFPIKDLTSGFRAVKAPLARSLVYLLPNTYSYPTTLTLGVLRSGSSLKYHPIDVRKRRAGKSNIKVVRDGVRFFMIIIKICTLYSPLRIFFPVSFLLFSTGFLYYLYTFLTMSRFTNMSALLFTTSIVIFMMGLVSEQICQMRFDRREGSPHVSHPEEPPASGETIG